jgi:hypothetical protein
MTEKDQDFNSSTKVIIHVILSRQISVLMLTSCSSKIILNALIWTKHKSLRFRFSILTLVSLLSRDFSYLNSQKINCKIKEYMLNNYLCFVKYQSWILQKMTNWSEYTFSYFYLNFDPNVWPWPGPQGPNFDTRHFASQWCTFVPGYIEISLCM